MPHLSIQYSKPLQQEINVDDFCDQLATEILSLGPYPLGGIRVRAFPTEHFAIADQHPQNNFVDMVFRIGKGRSEAEKKLTGECIMKLAEAFFAEQLASGFFMLSLEIIEISKEFSWKTNSVHQRLQNNS